MITQLPTDARLYGVAAGRDQARLLLQAAAGFIHRTPLLHGLLRVERDRIIFAAREITLQILAADAPRAWGLRPHFFVVDELAQWPTTNGAQAVWEATRTAMTKVSGVRLVVLTTVGDPTHWSYAARNHAAEDPLWRLHEVPGPPPWADHARLEEQQRSLPPATYERLFNNVWTIGQDRLTSLEDLHACVRDDDKGLPRRTRDTRCVIGVDIGVVEDRTAAAACYLHTLLDPNTGATRGATVVLNRMKVWESTHEHPVQLADVESWLARAARQVNAEVVFDPYQAIHMAQNLDSQGIDVATFAFTRAAVSQLALTLHQLIRHRALSLPNDPALLDELANVRIVEPSPGIYRLDHDAGRHDDRAIALGIAAHHLLNTEEPMNPRLVW